MARKKPKKAGSYRHDSASRINQPTTETSPLMAPIQRAAQPFTLEGRDTGLAVEEATTERSEQPEPRLAWDRQGRTSERDDPIDFAGIPLYIREKVHPLAMIDQLRRPDTGSQGDLFDDFNGLPPDARKWEFYQHSGNWQNRLIHGDSSEVMQSLIARDGLAGQVQMIYFDPPYGIRFKSNFMTATDKMETTDNAKGVPFGDAPPLKAFRDTYERGIHSYLDGTHERLILFRELLKDSGSMFLQIGDENVHRLAVLCDEVFGPHNRVATITWRPTGGSSAKTLPESASYLLWYAKDKEQLKYHQLYEPLGRQEVFREWSKSFSPPQVEFSNGTTRKLTELEKGNVKKHLPGARIFRTMALTSQGASTTGRTGYYEYKGVRYHSGANRHWCVSTPAERTRTNGGNSAIASGASSPTDGDDEGLSGLDRLAELGRLHGTGKGGALHWKWYEDEVAGRRIDNVWHQMLAPSGKRYVVQTSNEAIKRCILMSTDPGDLVLDPTCGSGATAHMAEQWGRRWITIDVGRVAIAIARRHLLTTVHPWYRTLDGATDPASGFDVETIQRVSAATLAYDTVNNPENTIYLVDRPKQDTTRSRLTGPFTVESASPYSYLPFDSDTGDQTPPEAHGENEERLMEALRGHSVFDANGRTLFTVDELTAWPESRLVGWEADCSVPGRETRLTAAVMIAPQDITITQGLVTEAMTEARRTRSDIADLIVVAHAFEDSSVGGRQGPVMVWTVQPSRDLLIPGLATKKDQDAGAFTLLGEPDVECRWADDNRTMLRVTLEGFDTYDPATGHVAPSGTGDVDCWMIDTDHNRSSFFPRLVYLPAYKRGDRQIKNLLESLGKDLDPGAEKLLCGTESQPFPPPAEGNTVAVKIITRTGAEMTTHLHPPGKR